MVKSMYSTSQPCLKTLRKETADFSVLSKLTVKISYWVQFVDTMAHGTYSLNIAIEFPTHVQCVHLVEHFSAYST